MGMSITGQKWVGTVSVLVLFTVAFLLRAVGADYGYFHGDERINEAAKVLTGQLVPEQHFYPPLINYLNAIGLAGLFGLGQPASRRAGLWDLAIWLRPAADGYGLVRRLLGAVAF